MTTKKEGIQANSEEQFDGQPSNRVPSFTLKAWESRWPGVGESAGNFADS